MEQKKIKRIINTYAGKLSSLRDRQKKLIVQLYKVSDQAKVIQTKNKIHN